MAYHLEGRLLELCTCGAYCPCRVEGETDDGACDAVNTWHIEKGTIDGTDVSGLTLVALNKIHGHVLKGRPVVFYVDDKATDEQQDALLRVWNGELGGPVADLAQLIGEIAGVERATIAFPVGRGHGSLKVDTVVAASLASPAHEGPDHTAGPHGDICTTVPGSESRLGEAASFRVNSPAYGFDIDLKDWQVLEGRFRFDA